MRARRPLLGFVLGAIALTAALGLYAVLSSDFGETQGKILATSAAISVASILALACMPAWDRGLLGPVPPLVAGLVLLALVMLVVGVWRDDYYDDEHWDVFFTVLLLASWGVLTCLLALARLAPRYRWTFYTAISLTLFLTLLGIMALWNENASDDFARLAGAVAVLSAAFVLAVPVLSRATPSSAGDAGFCPRCGRELGEGKAEGPCPGCGARFRVRFL
jgi:hypothetical protein